MTRLGRRIRRIGFLVDSRLFRVGGGLRADEPMPLFLLGFRAHFDELVFLARVLPEHGAPELPYAIPQEGVRVVPLPPYPRIHHLYAQPWRYWPGIERALRATLPELDALWLNFGHPVSHRALALCRRSPDIRPFAVLRGRYERDVALRTPGPELLKRLASGVMRAHMRAFARRARADGIPCFTYGGEMMARLAELGIEATPIVDSLLRDEDLAQPPAPRPELQADLLVVGRLAPEKGVDVLLDALAHVRVDGRPATLRVVGSGESGDALRAQAQRLGLGSRVFFDGHVAMGPELFARYASARLLVIPSYTEGIPKTAYEAMAFGLPVLASAVGGLPEVTGNGERGRVVPPGDPGALARAANEMLADPEALRAAGERARRYVAGVTLERQVRRIVEGVWPEILS